MESPDLKIEFVSKPGASQKAMTLYCRRQFPFTLSSVRFFYAVPLIVVLVLVMLFPAIFFHPLDQLAQAFGISRLFMPLIAGGAFAIFAILLFKITLPIRRNFIAAKLREMFPDKTIIVEVRDDVLVWKTSDSKTEHAINSIFALMKYDDGLVVGLGSSAILVPKEAFSEVGQMNKFTDLLLSKMKPDAVARSNLALSV